MKVRTIHMLLEQRIILLVEKGLTCHEDDLRYGLAIGILNQVNDGRD